jgi:hypothetical protein
MTSHFARAGLACVGLFASSVIVMHVAQPELSAVHMAVSYYMNGRLGWVLGAGLVLLGLGSLVLAFAARPPARSRAGLWLLTAWGIGAIAGGIFPPDPPGHWDEPSSPSGMIHGVAAMIAFLAFPPGAWLLSRTSTARALAIACVVSLAVFFFCLAPVFSNRPPYVLGLIERVLLSFYVAWLVAFGTATAREAATGRARTA